MCAVCGAGGWKARRSNQSFPPVKTEVTLKFHRHPTEVAAPKLLLRADRVRSGMLRIRLPPILTRGVTPHLDSVSIVNQAVKDAISECGIADLLVPARDRQLRS